MNSISFGFCCLHNNFLVNWFVLSTQQFSSETFLLSAQQFQKTRGVVLSPLSLILNWTSELVRPKKNRKWSSRLLMHPQSSDTEQKPKAPLGAEKGRVEWSIPHRSNHHYPISFQKIFIFFWNATGTPFSPCIKPHSQVQLESSGTKTIITN